MEVRLQKAIAEAGLCSRRKAEELIEHGHVRVNGEIATIGMNVDPEKDKILVGGQILRPERKVYLMLNKPRGYITTAYDPYDRKHVLQLVHEGKRLFPVGRLDRDTTGILLLTNDGEFANRISHPRYEVAKTYEATLDDRISDEAIRRINDGLIIDGKRIKAHVKKLGPKRVEVIVHTGLNKEVKRLFRTVGYWVEALQRTEIQGVRLNVKEGKYRHLHASEIKKLLESAPKPVYQTPYVERHEPLEPEPQARRTSRPRSVGKPRAAQPRFSSTPRDARRSPRTARPRREGQRRPQR